MKRTRASLTLLLSTFAVSLAAVGQTTQPQGQGEVTPAAPSQSNATDSASLERMSLSDPDWCDSEFWLGGLDAVCTDNGVPVWADICRPEGLADESKQEEIFGEDSPIVTAVNAGSNPPAEPEGTAEAIDGSWSIDYCDDFPSNETFTQNSGHVAMVLDLTRLVESVSRQGLVADETELSGPDLVQEEAAVPSAPEMIVPPEAAPDEPTPDLPASLVVPTEEQWAFPWIGQPVCEISGAAETVIAPSDEIASPEQSIGAGNLDQTLPTDEAALTDDLPQESDYECQCDLCRQWRAQTAAEEESQPIPETESAPTLRTVRDVVSVMVERMADWLEGAARSLRELDAGTSTSEPVNSRPEESETNPIPDGIFDPYPADLESVGF
jgi:hypothetical protein